MSGRSERAENPLAGPMASATGAAPFGDIAVGEKILEDTFRLSRADLVAYAEASGDDNPIHQDAQFARSAGLPDVIAHGMLTMGRVGSFFTTACAGQGRIVEFSARFAAPVVVPEGDGVDVEVSVTLIARDDGARTVTLEAAVSVAGTKVLSRTRAVTQL